MAPTSSAGTTSRPTGGVQSFAAFQGASYFSALDGLRALAILLVLGHHTNRAEGSLLEVLQENGRYGVSFFFVISGFLICTLLLREERRTGQIALGKFYSRRALRLLPLYYAVLALQAVLVFGLHQYAPENEVLFREKLPAYLFYYSNWLATATQGPFFCAWSLAVEEQFYLGFGLLLCIGPLRRSWLIGGLVAALALKFAVFELLGAVDARSTAWRIAFSYQEAIIWGVLLAFALEERRFYDAAARVFRSGWTVLAIGGAATAWLLLHPMEAQSTWDAELLYLAMTAILAGVLVRPRVPLLSGRLLSHLGRVSYGIYLLHMFVISAVRKLPGGQDPLVCFVLTTIITLALASVVYRCFEEPIIRFYKRRFSADAAVTRSAATTNSVSTPA